MRDQKTSGGRFPRRTPGPWPGREAGAARRRRCAFIPGKKVRVCMGCQTTELYYSLAKSKDLDLSLTLALVRPEYLFLPLVNLRASNKEQAPRIDFLERIGRVQVSIPEVMASAALVLSIYTLYQTSRYRSGDHLIAAVKERAELSEILRRLADASKSLDNRWKAALSARGMLNSGLAKMKEATSVELQEKVAELELAFSQVNELNGPFARLKAEKTLQKLVGLRARADGIVAEMDSEEAEMRR